MSTFAKLARATLTLSLLSPLSLLSAQSDVLVDIHDLTPREHRSRGFVLTAAQTLRIEAVGAEPSPEYRDGRSDRRVTWWTHEDERDTWPAAAWILDVRTRRVVWDLREAGTERSSDGLRSFRGSVSLPAGVYDVHYASYPAVWGADNGDRGVVGFLRGLARGREQRYGGPYVEDGAFREFAIVVRGAGKPATSRELTDAARAFTDAAVVAIRPSGRGASERMGFELAQPTDVEVYAIGELRHDGEFDYGWIINADTRERVWAMTHDRTEHAGGARKNRVARETLRLPAGRYAAYFVTDDSHDLSDWNAVPATDPDMWGLTLRVTDAAARARVRSFTFEPVPPGQTIVSLTGVGDDELRSDGFTLRQPLDVRVYALGEGFEREMVDYAWIVDAGTRRRVWSMRYDDTEHAGGADKNRLHDRTLRLEPGSYVVYYRSDGSHSYEDWNSAPPAEARYWGVSVFPASGRLEPGVVAPFERGAGAPAGDVLAELVRMGNDERARRAFSLTQETTVRVYALGEGSGGDMYDYAWIEEDGTGRVVWEMTYRTSDHAGGARKNRLYDRAVRLPAGRYVLRYESDGSHAYGDWNADPPDDPEAWGVTVRKD
jgi:hypothetical protein